MMRMKFLAATASLVLLAACSTMPEATGVTGNGGQRGGVAPAPVVAPVVDAIPAAVGDRVFYGYDKYDLTAEAQATLTRQAEFLKKYPALTVTVEGHADERGTREYNLALGEKRAMAAKNFLVGLGVVDGRITVVSYGKERPAVMGSNDAAWAQNRRAVTVVTSK